MAASAQILFHPSQFPEVVFRDFVNSIRSRAIAHKFHYDSVKQTQKWLALHEAYSPARNDPGCQEIYKASFDAVRNQVQEIPISLIGLGAGSGAKDCVLIRMLQEKKRSVFYLPSDVSSSMVLVARNAALEHLQPDRILPFICDLASIDDLSQVVDQLAGIDGKRVITFFGMIPNFEPDRILSQLSSLVRGSDTLLFSANLAPGREYVSGIQRVLPQYDNELTKEWLITFLLDLGVERADGEIQFMVEDGSGDGSLKRIAAYFKFHRARTFQVNNEPFTFARGEKIRLFFSYRYTPGQIGRLLQANGIRVVDQWISKSEEEGVFLCCRN